jgi:hypothetical protein
MSSQPNTTVCKETNNQVISPFAQTTSMINQSVKKTRFSWPMWIVSGVLVFVLLGNAGHFSFKYLNDPYRTIEPFPLDKYLADFQPLTGSKFKADFKVMADLGWKENVGRLMVFTVPNDTRPILVLIPPKLAGIFFTKGQTYQVSLEVGDGGLIYADSCEKE